MPSDEYKSAGGGALRIKGAKVKKNKSKKKEKSDLEKNITKRESSKDPKAEDKPEEVMENEGEAAEPFKGHKTEAEQRFEEARKKKLLEKAESAKSELLKTHKERVEELNTYLSKLSEHHDMPKIGPG